MKHLLLLVFSGLTLLLVAPTSSQAQSRVITGQVTDIDNFSLPGVNIYIKGTTTGTITDIEGNYRLEVGGTNDVLVFSYIGYLTKEMPVTAAATIDVKLEEDARQLNEVIVTGYSYVKKRDIIGAIASVSAEDIKNLPVVSLDQALQGKAAGVQVTQSSGTPGGGITVRVRGNTSISASNRPLFIIDGVPVEDGALALRSFGGQNDNALSTLNPNDIESFQVLKDASAKAIYGSRAANGVVLITTKRGSKGAKTSVTFDVQRGVIDLTNKLDLLSSEELVTLQREAITNAGQNPDESGIIKGVTDAVNTDWIDQVTRQAIMEQYQMSISGGDEQTSFYSSFNYRGEEGVILNNQFLRFAGTLNIDHKVTDKLKFGNNLTISKTRNDRIKGDNFLDGVYSGAVKSLPYYFPFDEKGNIIGPGNSNYAGFPNFNPVGQAVLPRFQTNTLKVLVGVFSEYQFNEHFRARAKFSVDYNDVAEDQFEPSSTAIGGFLASVGGLGYGVNSTGTYVTYINTNTVTYNQTFGDHVINATAGTEFLQRTETSNFVQGRLFPSDDFTYITSAGIVDAGSSDKVNSGLNSYFAEARYDYKEKYFASVTTRYDGSSRFGTNNRFGLFPSVSAGYRITNEAFFPKNTIVDDLKVRGSYGFTGNERIGDFAFLGTFASTTYNGVTGTAPANLENPDLQWEVTREANVGIDLSLFSGRLQTSVDGYSNLTSKLLFSQPIPLTTGFGSIQGNIGEVSNLGVELSVNSINFDGDFRWSTNLNIAKNDNLVKSLADTLPLFRGYTANGAGNTNIVKPGYPLGTFWGLNFLGVDPATGDAIYEDINGDGQISPDDGKVIGTAQPDFVGGITNNLSYRGFDLSVFIQFSYGNELLNFSNSALLNSGEDINNNQVRKALDRWQKPGDITDVPRYELGNTQNNWHSNRFLEDGSFLRVKNISLGYNLPIRYVEKIKAQSIRIYGSATNVFTWTNYTGNDPEVSTLDGSTTAQGIDFFTLPQVKTMMLGINVKF
ncbi:TonB-dependent receptor [Imperialibacter roseus]|uniref:TonB-dependent receptor n=1 Tax=Imperialibacter roseus TaxID=1324217 RepID=A0ABZ0IXR7_9BACT|nr:TonB-dependent receptor [Imperialibacter roseus]WOK09312.1 TonB-dependent receptor [Imperialibacter roseus]